MFNRWRSQVAFALLGLCLANSTSNLVHAEDIEFVTTAEFESLHARLAEFERRLVHAESRTPAKNHCPICPNTPGVVAGAELLLIKPHHSEGETPGFGVNAASRFWLGWSGENGLGLRARWFQYSDNNPDNVPIFRISELDLRVFDLELTDKFRLGHCEGVLSAGLRYADYSEFTAPWYSTMEDSIGPVLGVELQRQVTDCAALFVSARGSLQYAADGFDDGDPEENILFHIVELQLGAQWTRPNCFGGESFIRGAFETQYWSGGMIGVGDSEDMGLLGGTIAIGMTR